MKLSPSGSSSSACPSYGNHDHSECQRLLPSHQHQHPHPTSGSNAVRTERTATFTVGPPTSDLESSSSSSASHHPIHTFTSSSSSSSTQAPNQTLISTTSSHHLHRPRYDHDRSDGSIARSNAVTSRSTAVDNPIDLHSHLQVPTSGRIGNSASMSSFAMHNVDSQRSMGRNPLYIDRNHKTPVGTSSASSSGTLLPPNGTVRLLPPLSVPLPLQTSAASSTIGAFSSTLSGLRRRCVAKNGTANVRHAKISRKNQRFFLDTFTTMVDIEWRFNLLVFALSFIGSWFLFACIWWAIAFHHGDLTLPESGANQPPLFLPLSQSQSSSVVSETPPAAPSVSLSASDLASAQVQARLAQLLSQLSQRSVESIDSTSTSHSKRSQQSHSNISIDSNPSSNDPPPSLPSTLNVTSLPADQLLHLARLILSSQELAAISLDTSGPTVASPSSPSTPSPIDEANVSNERRPCLSNIHSFSDALLFSIETQHTIGYGTRQPTDQCPEVIILLMLQAIAGCLIQCFVVGFVFAKLSRPQRRSQTLIFSKRAVINLTESNTDSLADHRQLQCTAAEIVEAVRLVCTGHLKLNDLPYDDPDVDSSSSTLQAGTNSTRTPLFRSTVDYSGDRRYRLQFRLGDVRDKSHIVNARVNAFFLSKDECALKSDLWPSRTNRSKNRKQMSDDALNPHGTLSEPARVQLSRLLREKRLHNFNQRKLRLTVDSAGPQDDADGELLLLWPLVVSHEIDCHSPFWNLSACQLRNGRFEIVIILEGTIESTGQPIQARTSYLPSEISWGERFVPMLQSETHSAEFAVNFAAFHLTRPQPTPAFSAQEYMLRRKLFRLNRFRNAITSPELAQSQSGGGQFTFNPTFRSASNRSSSGAGDEHTQRRAAILQLMLSAPDREQLRPDLLTNVLTTLHVPSNGDALLDHRTFHEVDLLLDLLTCTATIINRAATSTEFFAEQVWATATAMAAPPPTTSYPSMTAADSAANGWSTNNQLSVNSTATVGNQLTSGRSSQRNGGGLSRLLHLFHQQHQSNHVQPVDYNISAGNGMAAARTSHLQANTNGSAGHSQNKSIEQTDTRSIGTKFLVRRVETNNQSIVSNKLEHQLVDCERLQQL
jgi:hypothetical protein